MSLNNRISIRDARVGAIDCQGATFSGSDRSEATTKGILLNTDKRQQYPMKHPLAEADRVVSKFHRFMYQFFLRLMSCAVADIA